MRRKYEKSGENVEKIFFEKMLDTFRVRAYSPPPVAVLTGTVTSERIGERRGDTMFEDSSER